MQLFRDRHRVVGANLTNAEFEHLAAMARANRSTPGAYTAALLREHLAGNPAPSVVPEIEEPLIHA